MALLIAPGHRSAGGVAAWGVIGVLVCWLAASPTPWCFRVWTCPPYTFLNKAAHDTSRYDMKTHEYSGLLANHAGVWVLTS